MSKNGKPKILVCSSGGEHGIAMLGALEPLYEIGYLNEIDKYVATSVGTIISILLAVKYSPKEIYKSSLCIDFYKDFSLENIKNFTENYGLINQCKYLDVVKDMIIKKLGEIPTLLELYEKYKIDITTVSINISRGIVVYISYRNYPKLSILKAIEMSCSIPFIFHKCEYLDFTYIDGFVCDPFPIKHADDGKTEILGVNIDPKLDEINSFSSYLRNFFFSVSKANKVKSKSTLGKNCKIISFSLSGNILLGKITESLFEIGIKEGKKFLEKL